MSNFNIVLKQKSIVFHEYSILDKNNNHLIDLRVSEDELNIVMVFLDNILLLSKNNIEFDLEIKNNQNYEKEFNCLIEGTMFVENNNELERCEKKVFIAGPNFLIEQLFKLSKEIYVSNLNKTNKFKI